MEKIQNKLIYNPAPLLRHISIISCNMLIDNEPECVCVCVCVCKPLYLFIASLVSLKVIKIYVPLNFLQIGRVLYINKFVYCFQLVSF